MDEADRLLTPGEVAALFRVDPKTVTRWAQAGRLSRVRTPGGHSRFVESQVRALLKPDGSEAAQADAPTSPDAATTAEEEDDDVDAVPDPVKDVERMIGPVTAR